MTTHTPTPWKVELHNQTAPTIANQYETVAELTTLSDDGKQEVANARFIVTACNAHEELVKIAQAYRNLLKTSAQTDGEVGTYQHIERVLDALADGKERTP